MRPFASLFTPETGHRLPEHQARLVRRALIGLVVLVGFFALFDALFTGYRLHAAAETLSALALATIALLHARGLGSERAATLGILVAGVLVLVVALSGEARDGVFVWLVSFPTFPVFLLGRRLGLLINAVFTAVAILALSLLIQHQDGGDGFTWVAVFNMGGAMIAVTALTFLYETMRGTAASHLVQEAKTDPLTSLLNRRGLLDAYPREVAAARRFGRPLSLLVLDLDHFKRVNDDFGHDVGDLALQFVVGTMKRLIRQDDWPARVGGEEFAVLLPNTDMTKAQGVAEKIRAGIEASPLVLASGRRVPLTVSIGIAQADTGSRSVGEDLDTLFIRADRRLYKAKGEGRNRVVWED
ncbi:MAG: GGDEF domain-containing protein [Rhodospirillum sp.]|nr:GGDEF domain-containing protein [Rhodospirillum sp.]MCF8487933.1 GGDEF domain-containing protein [Rhodospirillum sp.]MCF8500666.1 GGDEF domain-containing protein [Rhodospirillum sp.]